MKRFYVTFGEGTLLRGFYVIFEAHDSQIVAAYLDKRLKQRYSQIYDRVPEKTVALREDPEVLHYAAAAHI